MFPISTEDGSLSWGASFPDIECVVGGGDTPDEAIKEAYENLDIYLKDSNKSNLPQATNPFMKEYSGRFVIRISKQLHRNLAMCAEKESISLNAFCAEVLARSVERKSIEQKEKISNTFQFNQYNQINVMGVYSKGGTKC